MALVIKGDIAKIYNNKGSVNMTPSTNNNQLCKIVYFDEESITDYIQIVNNGELEKTSELLSDTVNNAKGTTSINGKIGMSGLIKALLGNELSASANAEADASYTNERMVKTIVKNTILSDFISVITKGEVQAISKFSGYKIDAPKDSFAYVALISPYFGMLKGANIPAGEFNISTEKLDNTIKSAKGYYEFLGIKEGDNEEENSIIFRFNMKSFRNNYKPTDLLKMNLSIYAIKVGESTKDMLNFSSEFNINNTIVDNPSYEEVTTNTHENERNDIEQKLDVYDVLLAGVEYIG